MYYIRDNHYNCGVSGCGQDEYGQGSCIHRVTDLRCPCCLTPLIEVTTTGFLFCAQHESVCDYEYDPKLPHDLRNPRSKVVPPIEPLT